MKKRHTQLTALRKARFTMSISTYWDCGSRRDCGNPVDRNSAA
jgi:hypothetical protein